MISDEMIAEAAAELNEVLINSLPDPHECKHQFSKEFERKMERLIHRVNHPVRYMVLNRVASILLVILFGFTIIMSFCSTARATVIGWIKETFASFHSYRFESDVDIESNQRYQIDPLPEGYFKVSHTENNGFHVIVYADEESILVFSYAERAAHAMLYINKEEYFVEETTVNGNDADMYISQDESLSNGIVWCDTESGCMFYISGQYDCEELIKFAEHVNKVS